MAEMSWSLQRFSCCRISRLLFLEERKERFIPIYLCTSLQSRMLFTENSVVHSVASCLLPRWARACVTGRPHSIKVKVHEKPRRQKRPRCSMAAGERTEGGHQSVQLAGRPRGWCWCWSRLARACGNIAWLAGPLSGSASGQGGTRVTDKGTWRWRGWEDGRTEAADGTTKVVETCKHR